MGNEIWLVFPKLSFSYWFMLWAQMWLIGVGYLFVGLSSTLNFPSILFVVINIVFFILLIFFGQAYVRPNCRCLFLHVQLISFGKIMFSSWLWVRLSEETFFWVTYVHNSFYVDALDSGRSVSILVVVNACPPVFLERNWGSVFMIWNPHTYTDDVSIYSSAQCHFTYQLWELHRRAGYVANTWEIRFVCLASHRHSRI